MKKLLCLPLALLLCAALIMPVFADIILPPEIENTVPAETLSGQLEVASQAVKQAPASASSVSPTTLYLAIGFFVVATALALFLLLRKKAR